LLNQGRLPVVRGLALTVDDLLQRVVIMALMCQGQMQFESIELALLIDFKSYFAKELEASGCGVSLMAGPWLRLRAPGSGTWAIRLAGAVLLASSVWALWMGLVHDALSLCWR
jgi:coproporphyrinogen III oxidase-like Fe-S oxidoreductase